jgi:hypothetical protein
VTRPDQISACSCANWIIAASAVANPEPITFRNAEKPFEIFSTLQASEAYSEHVEDLDRGADLIDKEVRARLKMGAGILAWEYVHRHLC